jgi:hypothetical protein
MRRVIQRYLLPVGIPLAFAGIGGFFLLEYASYQGFNSKLARAMIDSLLVCYPLGLLFTLAGSVFWARRGDPGYVLGAGLFIVFAVLLAGFLIPLNVHNWTMSLGFAEVVAVLIAILFFIFGIGRGLNS